MKRFTSLGLLVAAALNVGCSPQVGEEYTGEVLLRLSGSVKTESEAQASLEPALMFSWGEGLQSNQYFVRGNVEGVFPSKFVLSVTEPPPDEVISNGVAFGTFALIPAHTPAVVESPETFTTGDCGSGEDSCQQTQRYCLGERCYERDMKCELTACELLHSEGDPELVDAYVAVYPSGETKTFKGDAAEVVVGSTTASGSSTGSGAGSAEPLEADAGVDELPSEDMPEDGPSHNYYVKARETNECRAGVCLHSGIHCTIENECYSELRRCEDSNTILQYSYGSKQALCEVTAERGDRSLLAGLQVTPTAQNYSVIYLTEEALERYGDFLGNVKVGYNLFENDVPTNEQLLDRGLCLQKAAFSAIAELNHRHDMEESLGSWSLTREQSDELGDLEREFQDECQDLPDPVLVENPSDTKLRIEVATPVSK